jgi:regulator of sigma E protease
LENREELNAQSPTPPPAAAAPQPANKPAAPPTLPLVLPPAEPPSSDESGFADEVQTLRQWLIANSIPLAIVAAVIVVVFYYFRLDGQLAIAKAFLGLSFVVFVHELGHFMVAKWCDVEVTTFSIGFGPAVPGCAWKWGETTYKFSLIPIGGYVQMVGQVDGDEGADGSEDNPRSYRNKSVGQRMAIISAGVIMNVILAVICFIIVYQGPGKERAAGVVGTVDSKAPSFKYGIRGSARITQIDEIKDPYFEDLVVVVMSSRHGERIPFVSQLNGGTPQELEIEPRLDKDDSKPMIGISPPKRLELQTRRGLDPDMPGPVEPGTAAAAAQPAFEFGDRIVACSDPADPKHAVTPLPDDPRFPGHGRFDYFEFEHRMKQLAGETVVLRVERHDHDKEYTQDITVAPMFGRSLGMRMQIGQISAIRVGSPAEQADLKARDPAAGREGDLIEAVEVVEADGMVTRIDDQKLDPVRLPHALKQWAQRLADAEKRGDITAADRKARKVKLIVRRHRAGGGPQFNNQTIEVAWDDSWRYDDVLPMSTGAPMAIPELGLAYQIKTIVAGVEPTVHLGQAIQVGDVVKNFRFTYVNLNGQQESSNWQKRELEEGDWARIANHLSRLPVKIVSVELKVERGKDALQVTLVPTNDVSWPLAERGWLLMTDTRRQRADSLYGAISLGMRDTVNGMMQVFQNLRGMITGRVSIDNLGGPVMIANVAYKFAGYDFWEFVFFLGLISVNLAVVNFLPIPVLDGGHMVFLIYEKLRGRPASEPVRVGATYAGLAMILSLFLFVMFNDIRRFFF